jgi:hypothetical protein
VIVYDLYFGGSGFRPDKADPELVIDPDAVLSFAISSESLQVVARHDAEVLHGLSRIQKKQLAGALRSMPWYSFESSFLGTGSLLSAKSSYNSLSDRAASTAKATRANGGNTSETQRSCGIRECRVQAETGLAIKDREFAHPAKSPMKTARIPRTGVSVISSAVGKQ